MSGEYIDFNIAETQSCLNELCVWLQVIRGGSENQIKPQDDTIESLHAHGFTKTSWRVFARR